MQRKKKLIHDWLPSELVTLAEGATHTLDIITLEAHYTHI